MVTVSDITVAVAEFLHDSGVAEYHPDVYPPGFVGPAVSVKRLPKSPNSAVAVAVYGVDDATLVPGMLVSFQLRFRAPGTRTAVDDFADSVFPLLHMRHHFDLSGVRVQRARRINVADLGPDENGREQRADNYELLLA